MTSNPSVVIGDIHGDNAKLIAMISKIREMYGEDVDLYSTGDLIDRGSDSKGVIETCIQEGVSACVGNHDFWVLQLLHTKRILPYLFDNVWGIVPTLESYGVHTRVPAQASKELLEKMPQSHKDFFMDSHFVQRVDMDGELYWLTHSGIEKRAGESITASTDIEFIDKILKKDVTQVYFGYPDLKRDGVYSFRSGTQIFGHQILKRPIVRDRWIAIDTGCGTVRGAKLTAVILPDRKIIQV